MAFEDNPFKAYAGSRRLRLQTPTDIGTRGKPLKRGQAAPGPAGTRVARQASFTEAFSALLDGITGTANKNTPNVIIGPGAEPYLKNYQPGKGVRAVVLQRKQ